MASFAEFLAAAVREEVILGRLSTRKQTTGWTAVGGGAPSSYQTAMSAFIGSTYVPGGVHAKVTSVIQNDVVLTARASLALVDANAGSWYWDEAAALLYVRTTAGGDPDTYTMMAVERDLLLSTTGIVLNDTDGNAATGRYWHPWIVSDLAGFLVEAEDVLQGRKLFPEGALTLASVNGLLHSLVASDSGYTWENTRIAFSLGGSYNGQTLLKSQYSDIATMAIYRVNEMDDVSVTFGLRPLSSGPLAVTAPVTPIFASEYPRLGDSVSGTRKFLGYGRAWVRPPLVDTADYGTFLVADAAYQTLYAVHDVVAVPKGGGTGRIPLSVGSHYTVNLTTCTVTLLTADFSWMTHDIDVDVTGKPGGVRGYLSTFAEIANDLLVTVAGVASADLDAASFTASTAAQPNELSVWLTSSRVLASIFSTSEPELPSLERSVYGTIGISRAGLWQVTAWSPPKDVSTLAVLRKEQCVGVTFHHRDEHLIVGSTRVFYAFNAAQGTWAQEAWPNAAQQYLAQTGDELAVYTFLRHDYNALALAQRYQLLMGTAIMEVHVEEIGASQFLSSLMDRVLITYSPAPAANAAYTNRTFEFVRLERIYSPMLGVTAGLWDVEATGLVKNGGVWMASGAPTYAAATAAEREAAGFWTDANGDPGSGGAFVGRSKWG